MFMRLWTFVSYSQLPEKSRIAETNGVRKRFPFDDMKKRFAPEKFL
jgi:hypothetical protein